MRRRFLLGLFSPGTQVFNPHQKKGVSENTPNGYTATPRVSVRSQYLAPRSAGWSFRVGEAYFLSSSRDVTSEPRLLGLGGGSLCNHTSPRQVSQQGQITWKSQCNIRRTQSRCLVFLPDKLLPFVVWRRGTLETIADLMWPSKLLRKIKTTPSNRKSCT